MLDTVDLISGLLVAGLLGRLLGSLVGSPVGSRVGSRVGFERERLGRAAGPRTHMLHRVGSCPITIVSAYGFREPASAGPPDARSIPNRRPARFGCRLPRRRHDPAARRDRPRPDDRREPGLVAAIGLAVGGGLYVAAVASTTIILSILAGVKREERDRSRRQTLRFRLHVERGRRDRYVGGGARDAVATEAAVVQRSEADDLDDVTIVMERIGARDARTVVDDVRTLPYVRDVQDDA